MHWVSEFGVVAFRITDKEYDHYMFSHHIYIVLHNILVLQLFPRVNNIVLLLSTRTSLHCAKWDINNAPFDIPDNLLFTDIETLLYFVDVNILEMLMLPELVDQEELIAHIDSLA